MVSSATSAPVSTRTLLGHPGGGGNFGVVTSFAYQLHAVGPMVLAGVLFYPFAKAKEYLRFYGDFSRQSPDELNTIGGLGTSHDGAKVGVMAVCYSGPRRKGSRSCGQSGNLARPWLTTSSPCPTPRPSRSWPPWPRWSSLLHQVPFHQGYQRWRYRHHGSPLRAGHLAPVRHDLPTDGQRTQPDASRRHCLQRYRDMGTSGPPSRPGWTRESEGHIRWTRAFSQAMLPFTKGFLRQPGGHGGRRGADLIREAFGANYQRLADLKRKYDPTNLFRHNQNITPTV